MNSPTESLAQAFELQRAQRFLESEQAYRAVLAIDPLCVAAHQGLGLVLARQGQHEAALASLREAVRLQPESLEALTNLALVLRGCGRHDEAAGYFEQLVAAHPEHAVAHWNLGLVRQQQGREAEAVSILREATRRWPNLAAAHNALSVTLMAQGQHAAALPSAREAVRLAPQFADAHISLGTALAHFGQHDAALGHLREAIRLNPNSAEAQYNLATTLLLLGNFAEGWSRYEWRWNLPRNKGCPRPPGPEWRGEPLAGRTILLYIEQGLGDTLQFVRYAPLVAERGGKVLLACGSRSIIPILSSCEGIERLYAADERVPAYHVHAPLASLPLILGTELVTIPAAVPYLQAPGDLVERWRERLAGERRLKIGIQWQGSPTFDADRSRSIPLAEFALLAALPGVRLFSLQKGYGSEQLNEVAWPLEDLGAQLDEDGRAFCETAAVMKNLDLVITSDTSIAHLAGALTVPVWVALAFIPDWRWLLGRDDSPWYPTMRLFRQMQPGDWAGVFARIAAAVQSEMARKQSGC